jgi:hypothetical protein
MSVIVISEIDQFPDQLASLTQRPVFVVTDRALLASYTLCVQLEDFMKPSLRPPRRPSGLSDSLRHQLNLYALAASAAEVGMLALSHPAQAKIVYTPAHVVLGGEYYQYKLDLNHDGVTDLTLSNTYSNDIVRWFSNVLASPAAGNEVEGSGGYASALRRGVQIGGRNHFRAGGNLMAGAEFTYSHSQSRTYGKWVNVHGRYLGIMFQIKGKPHYGWARLNVAESQSRFTVVLTGYAYETIANKPLIAGKTKGPDVVTVQPGTAPGSLGRLALGRK